MISDKEIQKIKKMSKEEKMEYLEGRIDKILSEIPEEDKNVIREAGSQILANLFTGEGMALMGKLMEQMFSGISEEDLKNLQNLPQQPDEQSPEDFGKMMEMGMGIIEKMMKNMVSGEGIDLLGKMMGEMVGDPEKMQSLINLSPETQEKLQGIQELTNAVMYDLTPEDYTELTTRIQKIYEKHFG
ncbi:MAG: hypothetical protein QXS27_06620 [Candidatus Jordarchaeaceae archaeon]